MTPGAELANTASWQRSVIQQLIEMTAVLRRIEELLIAIERAQ